MNGKQYIGTNAETFHSYDVVGPITGIALIVDDESEYRAGDESGYVLEVPCSYGTQQMANELYAKAKGKVYKGYEATKAALSPSAELGDGVTVNGLYSILAYRSVNFGGAHRATVSAPGENVINHEYPFKGTNTSKIQRQNKRNMAATRSLIEKTASEIRQRVEEVSEGSAEKYAELSTKLDSITLEVSNGKTESTFTLKAGETTLSSGTIKMTGLVTFENLSTSGQTTIDGGNIRSNSITADKLSVTDLSALKATIGGFSIGSSAIYNGMNSLSATTNGVYLGTSGIALGGGKFKVTSAGALTATNATITGTINATSGTFQSVTISGSTFSGTLSNTGGSFGGSLNYASGYFSGNLYSAGGSYTGSINSSGTFSGSLSSAGGSYNGSIYSSGTFTGTNTGKLTGTASGATLSSCTNIGYLSGNSGNNLYLGGPATLTGNPVQLANSGSATIILSATSSAVKTQGHWTFNSIKVIEGQKDRVLNTGFYGNRCLAAYETPQATFADYGVAALDKTGVCYICIDPVFERTVQPFSIPTVFLTKYGEGDIWVEQVDHDTLIVKGTPGLKFSWETRYEQGHLECERLPVSEFDEFCLGTPDYQQQYLVYIGQNEIDYSEEAYDYLVNFQNNSVDYANEAYEYYINFERSLVQ